MEGSGAQRKYQESGFWDTWYRQRGDASAEWSAPVTDMFLDRVRQAIDGIKPMFSSSKLRILELGCGNSDLAAALARDGHDVVGCDFSQEVIDMMRQRHPELEWRCCDALKLDQEFGEDSFDCVVAKTLLDCFLTRSDAQKSIRKWFEQSRRVLQEQGRFVLLDKQKGAQGLIGGGVQAELILVGVGVELRRLWLRVLRPKPGSSAQAGPAAEQPAPGDRREVALQDAAKDVTVRKAASGSVLVVEKVQGSAAEAGLQPGDRLLGVGASPGTERAVYGDAGKMLQSLLSGAPAYFVVEHPKNKKSQSQCDFLLRQQRARVLRSNSLARSRGKHELPPIGIAGGASISKFVSATDGLFVA